MVAVAGLPERTLASTSLATVWDALARVPDPEIPTVSIVELGIVRDVGWRDESLRVVVTPTYSGCPATDVIADDIRVALRRLGIEALVVDVTLSPPWTTDWIAPEARDKLRSSGIAPPGPVGAPRVDVAGISPLRRRSVACPRCRSMRTTLVAQFGSTACKALYRCDGCGEPFDHFKPF